MKMKLAIVLLLCLLPLSASWAQSVTTAPTAGAGVHFNNHPDNTSGVFGVFLGANIPIYTDADYGFTVLDRTVYMYAGHDAENRLQAILTWLIIEQRVEAWRFALGNGLGINIDGADYGMFGVKLEVGYNVLKAVEVSAGVDHIIPENRRSDTFVYMSLSLKPKVLG